MDPLSHAQNTFEKAFCAQTRQLDKKLSIDKNRLVAKSIRRSTFKKDIGGNNYCFNFKLYFDREKLYSPLMLLVTYAP